MQGSRINREIPLHGKLEKERRSKKIQLNNRQEGYRGEKVLPEFRKLMAKVGKKIKKSLESCQGAISKDMLNVKF